MSCYLSGAGARRRVTSVAAPALAAAVAESPGRSAAGNDDDLTTTTPRNSPATATDPDDVTRKAPSFSDAYIYGYDSAGNPALTDAGGYHRFSDCKLQDRWRPWPQGR